MAGICTLVASENCFDIVRLFCLTQKSTKVGIFRHCASGWVEAKRKKILPTSPKAHGVAAVYNTFKLNRHEKLIGLDASSFFFVLSSFFLRPSFALAILKGYGWAKEGRRNSMPRVCENLFFSFLIAEQRRQNRSHRCLLAFCLQPIRRFRPFHGAPPTSKIVYTHI